MQNLSEEQIAEPQVDPYLESAKTFHLEMPPYHSFDLSLQADSAKIYKILTNRGTIDAYCIWCDKDGVFNAHNFLSDNIAVPSWTTRHDGLIEIEYHCARNRSHAYHTYYFKAGNFLAKVGQFPSVADFQIPQAQAYKKILDGEQYKEFTRGIGLAAHGVGIGSFVYLRRIFENLIEEAHAKAQAENKEFSNDQYLKARMDEKIKMVKEYLPEFLVENRSLYAILSTGIHDLTEDECLKYFETVKIGIEQILDEKIIQKEKADKAKKAREAIQKVHGQISNAK
ncbi:MAG: hypothetical protein A2921_02460 [Candidatus Magasanikbacteria bacterium RIFCSPLOWO2_01_FULL_43_20b]|uniref:Uncharacterized protein n=1 Tax=Candidatus Magasanikbacteria bacterium RIFCSPLOWO2_12_FULL_43_12 TaxID=1798692 RepID=A0A1F6MVY6_9BACT|nr:MAG: hypothetical protein A3C74_02505 [Candidatus Magasanikbacteria bacterium RIFCSPHIGHO2_02_FULL_44_13]OGH71534.1 MAG: hypothetical protein A3I93_00680 [Candidatus Magasanikbacteria bacterium RIFCSPLOWO2_02_FULL_43_22]OGH73642.1 MAG: hypothetical protein A2921_02460 [Candidatus Magasanikbacteria bacterium RIFCSPLOWO2_01_FULL_43_20b]OGH75771.1 MAG: hypothetical protein A3G00_04555 [Candidatus Magasanikbacteria bacterium RIFCSPLOWO2_12_FULL_43_12]